MSPSFLRHGEVHFADNAIVAGASDSPLAPPLAAAGEAARSRFTQIAKF
jgi:broad specificity phosphatase PhoE